MQKKILDAGTTSPATSVYGDSESICKDGNKRKVDSNGSNEDDSDKPSASKRPRSTKTPTANAETQEEEDEEEKEASAMTLEDKTLNNVYKPIDDDKAANRGTQRDHPNYAWLKEPNEIKNNIGKIVQLPILPCSKPIEFSNTVAQSFLLTKQRAELLLERVIFNNESHAEKGMVICGPHGIGKSSFAYLLAAYAWVNRLSLVYIVCCVVNLFDNMLL